MVHNSLSLQQLVGKDLTDFKIRNMTEVYRINEDGAKTQSVGYFFDPTVAAAWAKGLTDPNYHRTDDVLVLTNNQVGFVIGEEIGISGDEHARLEVRSKALSKLTEDERKILGL